MLFIVTIECFIRIMKIFEGVETAEIIFYPYENTIYSLNTLLNTMR